jgi:putative membrane protein
MRLVLRSVTLAFALTCTLTAGQDRPSPNQKPVRGDKPQSPAAPFIGAAAMDGMAEVEHGRLAAQNASSAEVKRFAQRMVDDHSKAAGGLNELASRKEVALETELDDQHQAMQDQLAKLKGAAFDKAYMGHMVKAHLQAVAQFQQEAKAGQDPEVKAWAAKMLPMLQEHVKLASAINATVSKAAK